MEDILAGVYRLGARGVLVLNAHDGNIRPVQTAGDRLWERFPDRFLPLVNWWETLGSAEMEAMGLFTQDGGHGHGGRWRCRRRRRRGRARWTGQAAA